MEICTICLEPFKQPVNTTGHVNKNVTTTSCNHLFHSECLFGWFQTRNGQTTCPICLQLIPWSVASALLPPVKENSKLQLLANPEFDDPEWLVLDARRTQLDAEYIQVNERLLEVGNKYPNLKKEWIQMKSEWQQLTAGLLSSVLPRSNFNGVWARLNTKQSRLDDEHDRLDTEWTGLMAEHIRVEDARLRWNRERSIIFERISDLLVQIDAVEPQLIQERMRWIDEILSKAMERIGTPLPRLSLAYFLKQVHGFREDANHSRLEAEQACYDAQSVEIKNVGLVMGAFGLSVRKKPTRVG